MADFHQNGLVTTLHNLSRRPVEDLERELLQFSDSRPMTLVLPCLYSELAGPALGNIVSELAQVPYLAEIVIGLDRADREFRRLSTVPHVFQDARTLWHRSSRGAYRA